MKLEVILQKLGLLQTGKIMYIGGSDVLPAPLKPEQERQAVAALEQGDEAAKQTVFHFVDVAFHLFGLGANSVVRAVQLAGLAELHRGIGVVLRRRFQPLLRFLLHDAH